VLPRDILSSEHSGGARSYSHMKILDYVQMAHSDSDITAEFAVCEIGGVHMVEHFFFLSAAAECR
jgi:hypothetical protein